MSNFSSGLYFFQATALRVYLGLAFTGLPATAHTAQSEESDFASNLDILTIQPISSGNYRLSPYRLNANIVLIRPQGNAPGWPGFSGTSRLSFDDKPQQETAHKTNTRWKHVYDNGRISLQHLLRVEFKGDLADVAFRPGSVLIDGKQFKVTFRRQAASVEVERFKIMLQPRSISTSWSKPF